MKAPGAAILIVDDNPANLKVARVALEGEGYEVRTAADGEEAIAVLRDFRPRLILMDIQLPGVDGLTLTRRLKSDPATSGIAVVAVTAYAMKGDREKALAAGCDGYITKPIDPIRLPGEVAVYLGAAGGASPPVRARPGGDGSRAAATILVVEDNSATRKMFRIALEAGGYEVVEASDAAAALAAVEVRPPDLVIQDLVLPDMDGLDLGRRLRLRLDATPIICVSGFLSKVDEAKAMKEGFSHALLKPVDPVHLLDAVRLHLMALPGASPEGQGRRILVVDDDPIQLKLARIWLAGLGYEVLGAADGGEAIEVARRERPAAILSDVLMAGMDGFSLCLAVRRDADLSGVPVILMSSAFADEEDQALAARVGASALLSKTDGWEAPARLLAEALASPPPPVAADPIEIIEGERTRRVLFQLERQVQQNAHLLQRSAVKEAELSVLAGVAEALARRKVLNGVLGDVLAACLDMAGISKGALYLLKDDRLALQHRIGFSEAEVPRLAAAFGLEDLLVEITRRGAVVAVPSPAIPGETAQRIVVEAGVTALLIVPIAWGGTIFGTAMLGGRTADFTSEDALVFARAIGAQMGQAIGLAQAFTRTAESEERFRSLVESLDDLVVTADREGLVTGVYGRWPSRQGIDPSALVGRRLREIGRNAEAHAEAHGRVLAGDRVAYEWSLDTPGGTRDLQAVASPIRSADGAAAGLVLVSRDVTEEKRIQTQLLVSDRMVSIGTLAAGVAHEINNPLAAVLANIEYAIGSAAEGAPAHETDLAGALREAHEAAGRIREIVKDLKIFSRAEEERRGPVDVRRVLESSLRMAWNEVRHRARLVKEYGDIPPAEANESRLGQVFLNLIVNAAQAIPEGRADENEIRVTTRADGAERIAVEIRDTGPGIPPDALGRIFTPFFTTKPAGVGTGLGLAICQRIVTGFGGEITVESLAGKGTAFRVTLPVSRGAVESEAPAAPPAPAASRRGRVLIVDDDAMVCAAVRRVLSARHDVIALPMASRALERIAGGERFDMILCDLMMPVMTGMDFHLALEAAAPDQAARVVFLTGGAFTARAREFLDRVPNASIEKPFEGRTLRALVDERVG